MINKLIIESGRREFRDDTLELSKGMSPANYKGHGLLPQAILRAKRDFGEARLKLVVRCATKEDMKDLRGTTREDVLSA